METNQWIPRTLSWINQYAAKPTKKAKKHLSRFFVAAAVLLCFGEYFASFSRDPEVPTSPGVQRLSQGGYPTPDMFVSREVFLLISKQNLGHLSFHHWLRTHITEYLKGASPTSDSRKVSADGTLVVVGVEYGAEIDEYIQRGWKTRAVEPNPAYFEALSHKCVPSHCTLTKCAAGDFDSQLVTLNYQGTDFTSCMVKLQDIENDHINTLSIDVQGNELSVLKGSEELLNARKIDIVFAEYQPGENCEHLLDFLHSHDYVLFDTLWYGQNSMSNELENIRFDWEGQNSIDIHDYCKLTSFVNDAYSAPYQKTRVEHALLEQSYRWLQNDIIAIRRDLLNMAFVSFLANVSSRCGETSCESPRVLKIPGYNE